MKYDLKNLAEKLISRAKDYEAEGPHPARVSIDAISQMNQLETLIRQSIRPQVPASPQTTSPSGTTAPATRAPERPPLPSATLERMRAEYRPALQDQHILNALMDFQKNIRPPAAGFSPQTVPRVETQAKPKTARHAPGSLPVLTQKR